jgi:beta-lactamase superfamily II metal-dependent hydrolase
MKHHHIKILLTEVVIVLIILSGCAPESPSAPTQEVPPVTEPDSKPAPVPDPEPVPAPNSETDPVNVYVFAVGEALSVFIDDGDTEVLIDGGNDGGKRKDGGTVAEFLTENIDDGVLEYVIATHSHADHIGGLDKDIYDAFNVAHTIYGDKGTSKQYGEFWTAANGEESSEVHEDIDETISLSEGVTLSVFDILDGDKNTHNNSVISLFDYHGAKMLVTGDAEDEKSKAVHNALVSTLREKSVSDIELYIVGHHGSETSSSEELLSLIHPANAVISSVGPNHGSYNNPDISVLKRLKAVKSKVYATYVSGDITATFSAKGVSLSPPDSELITTENYADAA